MPSEDTVVLQPCLEHGLLFSPHYKDFFQLLLIPSTDSLQLLGLIFETLLRCLQFDKGGKAQIASSNGVMELLQVFWNSRWIWWRIRNF